jgi:hypothetical protein
MMVISCHLQTSEGLYVDMKSGVVRGGRVWQATFQVAVPCLVKGSGFFRPKEKDLQIFDVGTPSLVPIHVVDQTSYPSKAGPVLHIKVCVLNVWEIILM